MNGRVPLTVAQKHPFVDSVTRAGILLSYWENEEPSVRSSYLHVPETTDDLKLSPVYSLAVHNQSLWLLSGLEVRIRGYPGMREVVAEMEDYRAVGSIYNRFVTTRGRSSTPCGNTPRRSRSSLSPQTKSPSSLAHGIGMSMIGTSIQER